MSESSALFSENLQQLNIELIPGISNKTEAIFGTAVGGSGLLN